MRRSSAPSQLAQKKPRFSAPSKVVQAVKTTALFSSTVNSTSPDIIRILDEVTECDQVDEQPGEAPPLSALHLQNNADDAFQNARRDLKSTAQLRVSTTSHARENQPTRLTDTRYFSVMWCKMSSRKHKIWEGDAFLIVEGKSATMKDTDGKILCRGSGFKTQQLNDLEEGHILSVGGKQCQIQNEMSEKEFLSAIQSQPQGSVIEAAPPVVKHARKLTSGSSKFRKSLDRLNLKDGLVMPKPSNSHQWQNNMNNLPVVEVVVEPFLSKHLRPHQREGVTFLYQCIMGMRDFNGHGAILADEMGLGKTLQCIALLWTVLKQGPYGGHPVVRRALIVSPGSLVKNWEQEFYKWLGCGRVPVFAVNSKNKVQDYLKSGLQPVLIMSYEMFLRHCESLQKLKFDLLICDEGHRLKNASIRTTNALANLGAFRRVLLTGTPIQNDLQELHTLVNFCNPGLLGSTSEFRTDFANPIVHGLRQGNEEFEDREENVGLEEAELRRDSLSRLTSQCLLRRTHEVIQHLMPPKVEHVVLCEPSDLQKKLYDRVIASEAVNLQEAYSGTAGSHLRCILWLRKLCNHPSLLFKTITKLKKEMSQTIRETLSMFPSCLSDLNHISHSGKLLALSKLLCALRKTNEKVVLISSHTQTLDILETVCKSSSYQFLRLDGSTPLDRRQGLLREFNGPSSKYFVFLLSSRAGGVGLSLVGASRVVLFDLDWNPAADLQAVARVWRQGQKRTVHAYRFITSGSIEETVFQRQTCKQTLSHTVLDSRDFTPESFSTQDLKELLYPMRVGSTTHDLLDCKCLDEFEQHDDGSCGTRKRGVADEEQDDEEQRSCQLGDEGPSSIRHKEGDMYNLSLWNHIPKSRIKEDVQDPYLAEASGNLSFVFERKFVTSYAESTGT